MQNGGADDWFCPSAVRGTRIPQRLTFQIISVLQRFHEIGVETHRVAEASQEADGPKCGRGGFAPHLVANSTPLYEHPRPVKGELDNWLV